MSSILKALKKLEHEKASRKPDSFRIDAEILRGDAQRSFFSKGASLAAIALFLCGVGATYLFMKRHEVSVAVQVQPAQTFSTEVKSGPPAPVVPLSESVKNASDPLPPLKTKVMSGTEKPEHSRPSPLNMTPRQTEKQTVGTSRAVQPESKPVSPVVAPPAIVTSGPPLLKVQGIAFQDGSAAGVAVVNGIAVSKGSVIEGVRVEEIQNDRVMFSRDGKKFEIILDKSN
jgi:general secretion pathway protein B